MTCSVVWFRRDLRLLDNPALHWACQHSTQIIPVYIHAADEEQPWAPGAASRWWLHNSLLQLDKSLAEYGLSLYRFSGNSAEVLAQICASSGATEVVCNRLYDPQLAERDSKLTRQLQQQGIQLHNFHSGLLLQPGSVLNNQEKPYRVYTPFYRKARSMLDSLYGDYQLQNTHKLLQGVKPVAGIAALADTSFNLLDAHPWHEKLVNYWQPGELQAHELLDRFVTQSIEDYVEQRDIPSVDGTSAMSPYLHFGEITPQQIYRVLQPLLAGALGSKTAAAAERFLSQLLWREFAQQILWHYPHTSNKPMDARYSNSFWRKGRKNFDRWCKGETGVPIVDAGMKQLWETGWMHNRVRMIVASYLTKNLGISWLQGARWFWDTLVDADLANNSMGWQWVAGCGVDAAPYYRIFNPLTQTQRFDGQLKYVDHWLPEHRELDYPQPLVDLASSREQALQRYRQYINSNT